MAFKKNISSYSELFKTMENVAYIALDDLADEVKRMWYEYLDLNFYSQYEPYVYRREYAILEALVRTKPMKVGNSIQVEVYIDMNIMNAHHPNTQGEWDGETVVEMIESKGMMLENGIKRNPAYAYESVVQWLLTDYKNFLRVRLKEQGITI